MSRHRETGNCDVHEPACIKDKDGKFHRRDGHEPAPLTPSTLIQQLRQLVLEHPHAAHLPIVICPHGFGHRQALEGAHLNLHETAVVLEAKS